jgi:argininosuccinate synthase
MTNSRSASPRHRIVLAFAGDLESSIAVPWLAENEDAEIVAVTLDFGQSRDLEGIRDRALTLGAVRAHVLDVRAEFARDFLLPALKAGALDDRGRRLAAALAHAAIARTLVEIADIEQAVRVAHGGITSAARLMAAVQSLKPDITVLAPVREWSGGRAKLLEYAASRRLPLPASRRDVSDGVPPSTNTAAHAAGEAAVVDITFTAGTPVAINNVGMPLLDLIGSLDFLAGKNGVGRADRFETPAVSVLAAAHDDLQQLAVTAEVNGFSDTVGRQYAALVENGGWFSVLRAALDAYVDRAEQLVNGIVRVKLFHGACEIVHSHIREVQENDGYSVVRPLRYRA